MSRDTIGDATVQGWTVVAHAQVINPDGVQVSLTSHAINDLDNASADAGAKAYIGAVEDLVEEWQKLKAGTAKAPNEAAR